MSIANPAIDGGAAGRGRLFYQHALKMNRQRPISISQSDTCESFHFRLFELIAR
jgi:hypothetical protein